jgi:SAM-dependent methyltransferase
VKYAQVSVPSGEKSPICGVLRPCPVCGASAAVTVFDNKIAPTAGYDFSTPIVRCSSCATAYAGRVLAQPDLDEYYSSVSKYDTLKLRGEIAALDRERAALAITFLAPILSSVTSALDVGCASGLLLHELLEAGVKQVRGIDPAEDAAAAARALFNVTVTRAHAENYQNYGDFDLVGLMAVLEHLREPGRLLRQIAERLRPGGRMLIEVPDAGAFDRPGDDRPIEPFGEFSNEHINFLTIADVQRLARSVGLEVERWKTWRVVQGGPGLFVLMRRSLVHAALPSPDAGSTSSRPTSEESMRQYIGRSKLGLADVERRLEALKSDNVILYGAGNHTGRLLLQSRKLASLQVVAVLDRNHHLHGGRIGSAPIVPPAALGQFPPLPIIISTFNARHEIRESLQRVTQQPLVTLYD